MSNKKLEGKDFVIRLKNKSLQRYFVFFLCISLLMVTLSYITVKSPLYGILLAGITGSIALVIAIFFTKEGRLTFKFITPVLLFTGILSPPIRIPGFLAIRPGLIVLLITWTLLLLGHLTTRQSIRFPRLPIYKWLIFFSFSIVLSMGYMALVEGEPFFGRNLWELAKILWYFMIFAIISSYKGSIDLKRYYSIILGFFLVSAFFGFIQYFDIGGINSIITPYFSPTKTSAVIERGRIVGTTSNPNQFGALMIMSSSIAFSVFLFFHDLKLRIFSLFAFTAFAGSLLLSQSRSSVLGVFFSLITIFILFLSQKTRKTKIIFTLRLMLFGGVVAMIAFLLLPNRVFFRFQTSKIISGIQTRLRIWKPYFQYWLNSPLFGGGQVVINETVDNEWIKILSSYGIVGITAFFGFWVSLFRFLTSVIHQQKQRSVLVMGAGLLGTIVGFAVYMVFAPIYLNLQIMPLFVLLTSLLFSQFGQINKLK